MQKPVATGAVVLNPAGEIGMDMMGKHLLLWLLGSAWDPHVPRESLLNLAEACELGLGKVRTDCLPQVSILCSKSFYPTTLK